MKTRVTSTRLVGLAVRAVLLWGALAAGSWAQAQPTSCAGLGLGGRPASTGLFAEYFSGYFGDDQTFFTRSTAGLTRIDGQVNFSGRSFGDLTSVAANTAADPDRFSLRLRGSLTIRTAGTYTFYLTSDDAAYLWLDNAALATPAVAAHATVAHGGVHRATVRQASIYLTAGLHNLLLHYGELSSDNTLMLEYQGPDAPLREVVPSSVLCTAVQPLRTVATNLRYELPAQTVTVGTGGVSPIPTLRAVSATPRFVLANAGQLPAGLTINATTGQLTLAAGVGPGYYQANVLVLDGGEAAQFNHAYTFAVAAVTPAGCAGQRPDGGPATGGLYAEYYPDFFADDPLFFANNPPSLTRLEPQLNFPTDASWGNLLPTASGTAANPDHFSARFRGSLLITTGGMYTLYLTSDDASQLWLDNAALSANPVNSQATINNGGIHSDTTLMVRLPLAAGRHDLLLHYGDLDTHNTLVLEYEGPDAPARQVVPISAFCSSSRPLGLTQPERVSVWVAPNPNQGNFEVGIMQLQPGPARLQLVDMQGRICYEILLPSVAEQRVHLRLPGLPTGLYLLHLSTPSGTATHKMVVDY